MLEQPKTTLPAMQVVYDPTEPLRRLARQSGLTQEQYEAIKGYWLRSQKKDSWRNVLLIMLMRNTGFRPCEIVRPQKRDPRQYFGEAPLRACDVGQGGGMYWVNVRRAKKKEIPDYEAVILNPNLGKPLIDFIVGHHLQPTAPLFDINTRQMANIWYEACEATLGYKREPTCLRDLFVTTVSQLANKIVGYTAEDLGIASKLVGHSKVRTTRAFYEKLTPEQVRLIRESIPV